MSGKVFTVFAVLIFLALVTAACGGGGETVVETVIVTVEVPAEGGEAEVQEVAVTFEGGGDTLGEVQGRSLLNCGVSGSLLAFSYPDDNAVMQGFDADYCRAISAAVIGDSESVEFRSSNASERFPI
jgi:general L-amino acid transport system substrate-binding protein